MVSQEPVRLVAAAEFSAEPSADFADYAALYLVVTRRQVMMRRPSIYGRTGCAGDRAKTARNRPRLKG